VTSAPDASSEAEDPQSSRARPIASKPPLALAAALDVSELLRTCSILVVDDDPDNREIVATVLALAGAKVVQASNAQAAIDLAMCEAFDVLVSDIAMPEIDGCELVRRLADGGVRPPIAIALSGHGRPEDLARSLGAGFDHHLVKPLELDQLIAKVRERLAPISSRHRAAWIDRR
jgi:two-component system CheB/CheR fusion protein